jgi:DNA-binding NtrC family response regulator
MEAIKLSLIVSATHRDLLRALVVVESGRFREDLYFRVCGWTTRVPALRERAGDIAELCDHFLDDQALPRGASPTRKSSPAFGS